MKNAVKMTKLSSEIRINAPKERVWDILADLRTVQYYYPGVISAHCTSEASEGVGASRRCDLPENGYLEERVTEWKPGESYTINVYEGSDIVASFATQDIRFTLREDGQETIVGMEVEYGLKPGVPVDPQELERQWGEEMIPTALAGLKHYVETGEPMPMSDKFFGGADRQAA